MASGFVDFSQYLAANRDDEERAMQEALAAAESADADALGKLRASEREAMGTGRRDAAGNIITGQGDITKVGSYTDYLAAKKKASDAWAAMTQSSDPRLKAVRDALGRGNNVGARSEAAASSLGAREMKAAGDVRGAYEGLVGQRGREEAAAKAKAAADAERNRQWDAARAQYLSSVGNPSNWQRDGFTTIQDAQARAQGWLRMQSNDARASTDGRTARQLAWGDWSLGPGERFATGGEEAARIQNDPKYRNQWDRALGDF